MAKLFPDAATTTKAADGTKQQKAKRVMLLNQDTIAAKFLDPYDVSPLADIELSTLWRLAKKGDKWAEFWVELAASPDQGGDYRQGVFLSRFAEVTTNAGNEILKNENFRKCIDAQVFDKACKEFKELKPFLLILNFGKASQNSKEPQRETIGGLKRKLKDEPARPRASEEQVKTAASYVFKWLEAGTNSNFRMLMSITCLGGVNYSYTAADKAARAWLQEEEVDEEKFKSKLLARYNEGNASIVSETKRRETATGTLFEKA